MMKQWTRDYKVKLPQKNSDVSILRKIRRAIKDQMQLGIDNFMRGIFPTNWDLVQQYHEKKKINGRETLHWLG